MPTPARPGRAAPLDPHPPLLRNARIATFPEDLVEAFEPITGTSVTLRALRPEDRDIELAFVSGLSSETRSNRLLGGARAITREYIESLVSVDYTRDMALADPDCDFYEDIVRELVIRRPEM